MTINCSTLFQKSNNRVDFSDIHNSKGSNVMLSSPHQQLKTRLGLGLRCEAFISADRCGQQFVPISRRRHDINIRRILGSFSSVSSDPTSTASAAFKQRQRHSDARNSTSQCRSSLGSASSSACTSSTDTSLVADVTPLNDDVTCEARDNAVLLAPLPAPRCVEHRGTFPVISMAQVASTLSKNPHHSASDNDVFV